VFEVFNTALITLSFQLKKSNVSAVAVKTDQAWRNPDDFVATLLGRAVF
jgi:hypothetical protein